MAQIKLIKLYKNLNNRENNIKNKLQMLIKKQTQ